MAEARTNGCLTCISRDRYEIESDLATGLYTVAGAAAAYSLPVRDVRRHVTECGAHVMEEDPEEPIDSPEAVMRLVIATCQALRDIVDRSTDRPGQAIRAIAELTKLLDLRARATGAIAAPGVNLAIAEGDGAQALAIGGPEWQSIVGALNDRLAAHPEARAVMAEALAEIPMGGDSGA
ncbi:hypothetical protein [Streptomyces violaceusniger]|uniref:hypothetical protein n=1 Tax=Streptomyces violaceusniger TaxID=68280 RepID=UPI0005BC7A5F|nr:hypothetical protein [Streptomyces violaceusniger]